MLKINGNQDKEITFEVEIGGVAIDSISSKFRIVLDDIEYGFPAKVSEQSIIVELPALRKVLHRKLKEGESVQARLDLMSDGNVISPWNDDLQVSELVVSEALLLDEETGDARAKAKYLKERAERVSTRVDDSDLPIDERIRKKLAEKKQEIDNVSNMSSSEDVEMSSKIIDKLSEKLLGTKKTKREQQLERLSENDYIISRKKSAFSPRRANKTKGLTLETIKQFTKSDILAYIERAGTTNKMVQETIYNRAIKEAKTENPVPVLKEVIKLLKKKGG
jgi:hypothetical protein